MNRNAVRAVLYLCVALTLAAAVGCAGRKKKIETGKAFLPGTRLYQVAMEALGKGHLRKARELLDRVQFGREDRGALEPLVRLAIADATFYARDEVSLIDARSKYLDFVTLYGDHPLAPYAQFQTGICSLRQANNPSKDQTQTRKAIADLTEVTRRFPASPFAMAAREKIREAESSLAEHDFLVGRFYLRRKAYLAAAERFRHVLEKYPRFTAKDKVYFYLGQALIRNDNETEARIYLDKLLADFPSTRYAEEAKKLLAATAGKGGEGRS